MNDRTTPEFLYGTAWKEDRTAGLTLLALQAGFRAIDTANQRRHYYEAAVGEGLAQAMRALDIPRADLFLQTKFTYQGGQDHRLPYDPAAPVATQVEQSMASSLEHLGTGYVDSFVLHGPSSGYGWTQVDVDAWHAMQRERDAGRTRALGVSNVSIRHLAGMRELLGEVPACVQNRCFARMGWDRDVRRFCRENGVVYQGFSLLTANVDVLQHPFVGSTAERLAATPAQVIFAFARQVGMLPMTGTSDFEHMRQDLASLQLALSDDEIEAIEGIAG